MLQTGLHARPNLADLGRYAVTIIGLGVVYVTRAWPRIAFLVTILVAIYCSPVVKVGNFTLLLAAVAPWEVPARVGARARRRRAARGTIEGSISVTRSGPVGVAGARTG